MSSREKILAILTGGVLAVAVVAMLVNKMILKPLATHKAAAKKLRLDVAKYETRVNKKPLYVKSIHDRRLRTFGATIEEAHRGIRAHLDTLLKASGLDVGTLTTQRDSSRMGTTEVGYLIQAKGSLKDTIDFLYLLDGDQHLHRVDSIEWTPIARSTDVNLKLRYMTLVIDPVKGLKAGKIDPSKFPVASKVTDKARRAYAAISDRDLFRPYVRMPDPPKPPPVVKKTDPPKPPPKKPDPPKPPTYRVTSLSNFPGTPPIVLENSKSGETTDYEIGDDLMGGEIVMVEYLKRPKVNDPEDVSLSRMIVRIERKYYAVDLGDALGDRYELSGDRMPLELIEAHRKLDPKATKTQQTSGPSAQREGNEAKPGTENTVSSNVGARAR